MTDDDKSTELTAVAITMSVLALLFTVVVVIWMVHVGDVWPTGGTSTIAPCQTGEHCLPR